MSSIKKLLRHIPLYTFIALSVVGFVLHRCDYFEMSQVFMVLSGIAHGVLWFTGLPYDKYDVILKQRIENAGPEVSLVRWKNLNIASCCLFAITSPLVFSAYFTYGQSKFLLLYGCLIVLPYLILMIVYSFVLNKLSGSGIS